GALAILGYGLAGGGAPLVVIILFVPVNIGLGLRGPPGFYRAIVASNGNDGRASALVLMAIFGVTAAGSALAAPWVTTGLTPLAAIAAAISTGSFAALQLGGPLPDAKPASEPSGASL
ncbi:MAG: MFS transporter, partial [Pseudomonadota bacterium]